MHQALPEEEQHLLMICASFQLGMVSMILPVRAATVSSTAPAFVLSSPLARDEVPHNGCLPPTPHHLSISAQLLPFLTLLHSSLSWNLSSYSDANVIRNHHSILKERKRSQIPKPIEAF